tara:strand:+ start:496 stop:981 length:486 start_codon:yes stop_codon:yes gene_type:complete
MQNNFPLFIDIETSSADDTAFPTSISWSLPDGQLKSVLIIPDDEWEPWDNTDADIDLQHLFDQGVSGPDVIRELNEDLDGQTVYVDGLDNDESYIELLFDTYQSSIGFEIATLKDLFPRQNIENILSLRNEIAHEYQLDIDLIEDKVRSLIFMVNDMPELM